MTEYCMTEENKAFLLDLMDLNTVIGPRDLESKCQANLGDGQECSIEDPVFERNLKEVALELGKIPICSKGD